MLSTQVISVGGANNSSSRELRMRRLSALSIAFLFGLSFAVINYNGLQINPDGWAYWQGGVTMSYWGGFRYFSGAIINAWPPGYSILIGIGTAIVGAYAWVIIAVNAFGVAVGTWGFARHMIKKNNYTLEHIGAVQLFTVFSVFLYYGHLVHPNIFIAALIPYYFNLIEKQIASQGRISKYYVYAVACSMALLHNTGIVVACLGGVMIISRLGLKHGVLWVSKILAVIAALRWAIAAILGQTAVHSMHRIAEIPTLISVYAVELILNMAKFISGSTYISYGFFILCAMIYLIVSDLREKKVPEYFFIFSGYLVSLVLLFSVFKIYGNLGGRFLLPAFVMMFTIIGIDSHKKINKYVTAIVLSSILIRYAASSFGLSNSMRDASAVVKGGTVLVKEDRERENEVVPPVYDWERDTSR